MEVGGSGWVYRGEVGWIYLGESGWIYLGESGWIDLGESTGGMKSQVLWGLNWVKFEQYTLPGKQLKRWAHVGGANMAPTASGPDSKTL